MLLLCTFLLSCCLSGSMGGAIEEFQENFETLVVLVSKETFLPVPAGKFRCSCVPCHLEGTVDWLKGYFKNDPMGARVSAMEKNMGCIISALNKACTKPKKGGSCQTTMVHPQRALERYRKFFQRLHEQC